VTASLETYALALLGEEAGEVNQMLGKWGRFGPDAPRRDGLTARRGLSLEMGDVIAALRYGVEAGVLDQKIIFAQAEAKYEKLINPLSVDAEGRRLAPALPGRP
jgi:hypothetical protein